MTLEFLVTKGSLKLMERRKSKVSIVVSGFWLLLKCKGNEIKCNITATEGKGTKMQKKKEFNNII